MASPTSNSHVSVAGSKTSSLSSSPAQSTTSSPHSSRSASPCSTATSVASLPPRKETSNQTIALLLTSPGQKNYSIHTNWPRTAPQPHEILIRNVAIGLNPIDWKSIAYRFGIHSYPWINGRESAGIVEEVGEGVTRFQKGDRVLHASTNYRDIRTSTYQEFSIAHEMNAAHIPEGVTMEEGASIGVGIVAAAESLFGSLNVPWPDLTKLASESKPNPTENREWILIWGGASTSGMLAIQLAKMCNLKVAAVASSHNAQYLIDNGADLVLDRHNPEIIIETIRALHVTMALDCVGDKTAGFAAKALQPGGKLVCLVKAPKLEEGSGVEVLGVLIKRFHEDPEYGFRLMTFVEEILQRRLLRMPRLRVSPGGFEGVEPGLDLLRKNAVSGVKIVVSIEA